MIAIGSIDDIENEIETIKQVVNSINLSSDKQEEGKEGVDISIPKRLTVKDQSELRLPEAKPSRMNVLSQILEGEIERLKTEYNSKFEEFDKKIVKQAGMYQRSNYTDFLDYKDSNRLFDNINHTKRIEDASSELGKPDFRKRVVQNDMVLFQLYSRYREMLKELNVYKDKIMDNLRFEEKTIEPLATDIKHRKRSNSLQFRIVKLKGDILGRAKVDYLIKENPEKELQTWNSNINDRLIELEKQCNVNIPLKFHEVIRNRGILAQEVRVMDNVLGNLKYDVEDLKSNAGKYLKASEDPLHKNDGYDDLPVGTSVKQHIEDRIKSIKKEFDSEFNQ